MKVTLNKTRRYQIGGEMVAPEEAQEQMPTEAAPQEAAPQDDPLMQMAQMAAEALQTQDCSMSMQVCQIFLQMIQQAQGQVEPEPQGQPVFKKGGRLVRWNKK